jgi:hypothetical protein
MFSQLGVGMMFILLFLDARRVGNGFFKSSSLTAGILMGVPLAFDFYFPSTYRTGNGPSILLLVAIILTILYNRVMNLDKLGIGYALLVGAVAAGTASIAWDSFAFTRLTSVAGLEHWMLLVNNVAGMAILGAVLLSMLFGHWYLVIPKLSIDHLMKLTKVLMATILFRMITLVVSLALIKLEPALSLKTVLSVLMLTVDHGIFFWPRLICGIVAPAVLGVMIYETVKIKNTQSATGLLYVAVVVLLLGEFTSRFLVFAVQLPF